MRRYQKWVNFTGCHTWNASSSLLLSSFSPSLQLLLSWSYRLARILTVFERIMTLISSRTTNLSICISFILNLPSCISCTSILRSTLQSIQTWTFPSSSNFTPLSPARTSRPFWPHRCKLICKVTNPQVKMQLFTISFKTPKNQLLLNPLLPWSSLGRP